MSMRRPGEGQKLTSAQENGYPVSIWMFTCPMNPAANSASIPTSVANPGSRERVDGPVSNAMYLLPSRHTRYQPAHRRPHIRITQ